MLGLRHLVLNAARIASTSSIACVRSSGRHWRRILAILTGGVAIARAIIWIAKAVASAGTVDALLNLVGLSAYVLPFEQAVDNVIATVVAIVMTVTPNG